MTSADYVNEMYPDPVDGVEWGLWCTLQCVCTRCDAELELPFWDDPPWSGDVSTWAKQLAPQATEAGWRLDTDCFNLICPACPPSPDPGREAGG